MTDQLAVYRVVSIRVHATSYADAVERIAEWVHEGSSRYVCAANVSTAMEAYDCDRFRRSIDNADLVTADGVPIAWALRLLGEPNARRVYGPDLMLHLLARAERDGFRIGFYGSTAVTVAKLCAAVRERFPKLKISCTFSPPFRGLTEQEDRTSVQEINDAGAELLFVGLGCPKQERWMAKHRGRVRAVMVGVGAAFDFLAGTKPQAPRWMMRVGMEWLFRLVIEPRRLWRRYAKHNPRFFILFLRQLGALYVTRMRDRTSDKRAADVQR